MAKLRINGDSSGYVDLEAPNAASSSTLDLDQVPQKNAATTAFTGSHMIIGDSTTGNAHANADDLVIGNTSSGKRSGLTIVTANDRDGSIMWSDGTSSGNANIQGQLVYNHPDNSMRFYTAVSEGMRISGDGYITKPKQPSFNAQRTSNQGIQGGTTLIFNQARHNTGNHYNTSTGVFTAPVTGDYLFTFKALCYAFASSEYLDLYTTVNGTTRNRYEQTGNSGQHTQVVYTEVVNLNANDGFYLYANNRNNSVTHYSMYGNENHFSGYLLG